MIRQIICLTFAAIVGLAGVVSAGTYSGGGNGTAEQPYRIATAADMQSIGANPGDWGSHFVMVNDINLAEYTGTQFNIIGSEATPFNGVFDGNDHTVSNFTYTTIDTLYIGLFGCAGGLAVIRDLTLVNHNVNAAGNSDFVGCLVGYLQYGTVTGCGIEGGSVLGEGAVGGFVGYNDHGAISNCYTAGSVTGMNGTGELVGVNGGTISNCYAAGSVSGTDITGGLVGDNGGFFSDGTISNCYAAGNVTGNYATGGLVGENYGGTISNCYAEGSVIGSDYATGGLVGLRREGTIENCYSSASVSGADYTGGLVGDGGGGGVVNCFWDIETSGQSQSSGGKGKTTAEMKTDSTFLSWATCGSEGVWTIDDGNDYPRLAWEGKPGQPLSAPQLSELLTGSGTVIDPYIVYTAEQLNLIGLFSCEWDRNFLLANDIDLAIYSGAQFNVIGNYIDPFIGVFDGNGHTIFNFTYTTTDTSVGLFGIVSDPNSVIKDLTLVDPNVNAAGYSEGVGSLVGFLRYGTITGCGIEGGSVSGEEYDTGGLVGYNYEGTISNCYAATSVMGDYYTGGLVGKTWYGTISNSYAQGSVTGNYSTGGLVGYNRDGTISNCYAAGSVTGTDSYTGGLVGWNAGAISDCYAAGSVTGDDYTGGLVGWNYFGQVSNCYSRGSVSGGSYTGGLVGDAGVAIKCLWDVDTSGQWESAGGKGKTTAEMKTASTFAYAGWSVCGSEGVWTIDEGKDYPRLWWQNLPGQPLPCLPDLLEGTGSEGQPYLIRTAEQLNLVGSLSCKRDRHFTLANDIDLSGYTGMQFNIIGSYSAPFTGIFDGNGHTISNFTYTTTDTDYIGLFGYVDDANAVIRNLTLVMPDVNAASEYSDYIGCLVGRLENGAISGCGIEGGRVSGGGYRIGGLVGQNWGGTISNCYTTGSVSGGIWYIGGLVGQTYEGTISDCYAEGSVWGGDYYTGGLVGGNSSGPISNCYATGSVSGGDWHTGGLVGSNQGTISNSYAEGSVSGKTRTGGLVGENHRTISNCYATGNVMGTAWYTGGLVGYCNGGTISNCYAAGSVTGEQSDTGGLVGGGGGVVNCFWDIEIGGPDNGIGTPLPTSQMQTSSTFTDAGWDFIDETANGIEDIWRLCEDGTDYPKLVWQMIMLGDFVCPDGVEINDLDVFVQQWLMEKLSADVAVGGGDGVVDFLDWAVLVDEWQNTADMNDVAVFAGQWLQFGAYCADIAPSPGGDGAVDMLDFAVLAGNWLEGL